MTRASILPTTAHAWSLLIRHAARPPIPAGTFGNNLSLTAEGLRDALALGVLLGGRVRRLVSSPVLRCVQTAEAIERGGEGTGSVATSTLLGDPGVWIDDCDAVAEPFLKYGARGVVARQLASEPLPGIVAVGIGVPRLLRALTLDPGERGDIDVFVSHDAVIAPLLGSLLRTRELPEIWPEFLEGVWVRRHEDRLIFRWRGRVIAVDWRELCRPK